jgi:OOP family OmpA-OmpF porin
MKKVVYRVSLSLIAFLWLSGCTQEPEPKVMPMVAPSSYHDDDIDKDNDGVKDRVDTCLHTPKGAKVNQHGCMYDTDRDGVPDERDFCLHSLRAYPVDKNGCTIK